jgi:hypothetical protein
MSGTGAVKRIRTPHPHDVLSGRGGGINSHGGNKTFREWVRERKEAYNLAGSKAEKARVANEVIELVKAQNPPGRFLQRDPGSVSGPSWWVEVDEARALAKTSQALREGAPQIRLAHKDELEERTDRAKKSKRKKAPSANLNYTSASTSPSQSQTAPAPVPPPVPPPVPVRPPVPVPVPVPPASTFTPLPLPTTTVPIRVPVPPSSATLTRSVSTDQALESLQKNVQEAKSLAEQQTPAHLVSVPPLSVPPLMSNRQFSEKYGRPRKKLRPGETTSNSKDKQFDPPAETPPLTSAPHPPLNEVPPLKLGLQPVNKTSGGNTSGTSGNGLLRSHSLALSDLSTGDFTDGDEEFVNPFADESDIINRVGMPKPYSSRINQSDNNNILGVRNRSSLGNMSSSIRRF